ncbi:unnamed protein product, partial [Hapterophycus canaliculatus]
VQQRVVGDRRAAGLGNFQPRHLLVAEPHAVPPGEGQLGGVGLHHRGRGDNYNWRSLTSPGITGHFNKYCLASATANLMTCAPGDNTYDGVQTDVSLISSVSEFHSIYTTESTNGFSGFQIVPRYATFVYFNCVTGD